MLKSLARGQAGFASLEIAVILVAFLVTSGSLSYVYINASQKTVEDLDEVVSESIAGTLDQLRSRGFTVGPVGPIDGSYELNAHPWMASQALVLGDLDGARHHLEHAVELLADNQDRRAVTSLVLQAVGQASNEEVVAMIVALMVDVPPPTLPVGEKELYLELAQAAMKRGDLAFAEHYLRHVSPPP